MFSKFFVTAISFIATLSAQASTHEVSHAQAKQYISAISQAFRNSANDCQNIYGELAFASPAPAILITMRNANSLVVDDASKQVKMTWASEALPRTRDIVTAKLSPANKLVSLELTHQEMSYAGEFFTADTSSCNLK